MANHAPNIEIMEFTVKALKMMKSHPTRKWAVKDFINLTAQVRSERTIQRYMSTLEKTGVVTGNGLNPQGYIFNGI